VAAWSRQGQAATVVTGPNCCDHSDGPEPAHCGLTRTKPGSCAGSPGPSPPPDRFRGARPGRQRVRPRELAYETLRAADDPE
jgi:hypothetical protein